MGSVSDLINLARFKQQQETGVDTARRIAELSQSIKGIMDKRRNQENQKKLSDMLMKDRGNLQGEYSVGESGGISIKYKPKKDSFATAVKNASKRIAEGEDFDIVAGELQTKFPSNYKKTTEKYLQQAIPKSVFKSPKFKEGRGLSAWKSKDIANLDPATKQVISDIESKVKTEENFKKVVVTGRKKLEEAGVDVRGLLEYFGRDEFGNKRTDVWGL